MGDTADWYPEGWEEGAAFLEGDPGDDIDDAGPDDYADHYERGYDDGYGAGFNVGHAAGWDAARRYAEPGTDEQLEPLEPRGPA